MQPDFEMMGMTILSQSKEIKQLIATVKDSTLLLKAYLDENTKLHARIAELEREKEKKPFSDVQQLPPKE